MFCFKCGAQLLDGSLFCTFCGQKQPLIADGKIVEAPTADPTPVNESGNTADNTEWESWGDDDEDEARFTEDGAMIIPKEVAESGRVLALKWFETHQDSGNYAIEDGTAIIRSLAGDEEYFLFVSNTIIRSITIPESVTEIGKYAFLGCTLLTSINIPDSVTEIGSSAFESCTSLSSINIPDSVTKIGYEAFKDCTSLTSINIPDSVTKIDRYAFNGCTSLNISIPASLTDIADDAFEGCASVKRRLY